MHYARVETSARLNAVLGALRAYGKIGATTLQIQMLSKSLNVSTDVSALRHNGVPIVCEYAGRTEEGGKVYRYWLQDKHEEAKREQLHTGREASASEEDARKQQDGARLIEERFAEDTHPTGE
jgi:hypothetical protein